MSITFLSIPTICPACKRPTEIRVNAESGVKTLWCTNVNCGERQNQSFSHFVSRDAMNIVGLSEESLQTLMDVGAISKLSDILALPSSEYDLSAIYGWGEKKVAKLYDAIIEAMQVKLENFIYALGIANVGLQTAKTIAKKCNFQLDEFINITWSELISIDGIGDTVASSVSEWLENPDNIDEIDNMLAYGLTIIGSDRKIGTKLGGINFCCTGALYQFPGNRKGLKEYIESQGGKLTGSVSMNTKYLITNDTTSGSAKNKAAAALGIPVITEQQFIDMFGGM